MNKILINFIALFGFISILTIFMVFLLKINIIIYGVVPLFPLDDNQGIYKIRVLETGEYVVVYEKNGIAMKGLIGSTQLDLNQFQGNEVRIVGDFRPTVGFPLCYETPCNKNNHEKYAVIDIEKITTVD